MLRQISGKPIERREHAPLVVRVGWIDENNDRYSMAVHFGLHMIRGNSAPYFTVTVATGIINGRDCFGGCCHEEISEHLPELRDMIALHLSCINGVPMHAEANGWYWLAGACGGLGQTYHGGTHRPEKTEQECLQVFADHCRITLQTAEEIRAGILAINPIPWAVDPHYIRREHWKRVCESMRERWKAEAEAAIQRYGLPVFGDQWVANALDWRPQ